MKIIKAVALLMGLSIVGLNICACSNEPEPVSSDVNIISTQAQNSGVGSETQNAPYVFDYNNFIIGADLDVSKLPDDFQFEPVAECAFIGMAEKYSTSSFDVYVQPDTHKIYLVELKDDTVSTPEGIHIGSTVDEIKLAYVDEPVSESANSILYVYDSYQLQFTLDDAGKVTKLFYSESQF